MRAGEVRRFEVRAEFRRPHPSDGWTLAGVVVEHTFWPAQPGVEPVLRRLPAPGLLGWSALPSPIVAATAPEAAAAALAVARAVWPERDRREIPFGS